MRTVKQFVKQTVTRPLGSAAAAAMIVVAISGCSGGTSVDGSLGPAVTSSDTQTGEAQRTNAPPSNATFTVPCPLTDPTQAMPARVQAAANGRTFSLPQTSFPCLSDNRPISLSGYAGSPIVVHIWASWCEVCRAEMPAFAAGVDALPASVQVIGIDWKDDDNSARAYASAVHMPFPSVVDKQGVIGPVWGVSAQPATVFIRADGSIAHTERGSIGKAANLGAMVRKYLL